MGSKDPWWLDASVRGEWPDMALAGLDNDPTLTWHATGGRRERSTKALMRAFGAAIGWRRSGSTMRPASVDVDAVIQRRPSVGLDGEAAMGRAVRLIPKDRPDLDLAALDNSFTAIEEVARPLASASITRAYLQALAVRHKAAALRPLRKAVDPKRLGAGLDVDGEGLVVKRQRDGTVVSVYGKDTGPAERDQHGMATTELMPNADGRRDVEVRRRSLPEALAKVGVFGTGVHRARRLLAAQNAVSIYEGFIASTSTTGAYDITHPAGGDASPSDEALQAIGAWRRLAARIDRAASKAGAGCALSIRFSRSTVIAWLADGDIARFDVGIEAPAGVGRRNRQLLVDVLDTIIPPPREAHRRPLDDGMPEQGALAVVPGQTEPPASALEMVPFEVWVPHVGRDGRMILSLPMTTVAELDGAMLEALGAELGDAGSVTGLVPMI